jgi:hypothetical protein
VGLLVAAAVAFVVASSVKAKTGAQRLAPATPGGARADVLPRGQHWEPGCWEPDGQGAHARMRLADGARLAEGAAFVESAKSIIGVLQQYPIAGGESCIGEMSGLVRRLQPLVGRDDAAARTERVLLERRMESAWARVKNDTLRLSA